MKRPLFTLLRFASLLALVCAAPRPASAQMIDDGVMLGKGALFTSNLYTRERWDDYWEGTLKRTNANIGTITTQSNTWFGNYGLSRWVNVMAAVPYVWTRPSQGVLHGSRGVQDLTVAGKFQLLEKTATRLGTLRAFAVASAGIPLTDYNLELLPLSIGMGTKTVASRGTVNLLTNPGWFVNGSAAYTWRSEVTLDRPYFYTNGEFVTSDHVDMPNVVDGLVSGGYMTERSMASVSFMQQRTLGGGDIRRQDMPFVSNRMNASKIGAMVMAPVPHLDNLGVHAAYAYTLAGRNVGQASTFTAGVLYRFGRSTR